MWSTASPNIVLRFCLRFSIGRPFAVLVSELVGVGTPWLVRTNMLARGGPVNLVTVTDRIL